MRDPGEPEVNRSPPHIRALSSEPVLSHSQRMTSGDAACKRSGVSRAVDSETGRGHNPLIV